MAVRAWVVLVWVVRAWVVLVWVDRAAAAPVAVSVIPCKAAQVAVVWAEMVLIKAIRAIKLSRRERGELPRRVNRPPRGIIRCTC